MLHVNPDAFVVRLIKSEVGNKTAIYGAKSFPLQSLKSTRNRILWCPRDFISATSKSEGLLEAIGEWELISQS